MDGLRNPAPHTWTHCRTAVAASMFLAPAAALFLAPATALMAREAIAAAAACCSARADACFASCTCGAWDGGQVQGDTAQKYWEAMPCADMGESERSSHTLRITSARLASAVGRPQHRQHRRPQQSQFLCAYTREHKVGAEGRRRADTVAGTSKLAPKASCSASVGNWLTANILSGQLVFAAWRRRRDRISGHRATCA